MTEENKSMRDQLLKVLGRNVPKDWSTENQYGVSLIQGEATNAEAIAISLVAKAINGDLDAIKYIFQAEF